MYYYYYLRMDPQDHLCKNGFLDVTFSMWFLHLSSWSSGSPESECPIRTIYIYIEAECPVAWLPPAVFLYMNHSCLLLRQSDLRQVLQNQRLSDTGAGQQFFYYIFNYNIHILMLASCRDLMQFMILCWATLIAMLGRIGPRAMGWTGLSTYKL